MAGLTDFARLMILQQGDHLSDNGYQFTDADRRTIDMLLRVIFGHRHTGELVAPEPPVDPPDLTVDPTGGHLDPATLYYYKYTLVSPEGIETEAGPEASASTPVQVEKPGPPTLTRGSAAGTLKPGQYVYQLSAYRGSDTLETESSDQVFAPLPAVDGDTQRVIVTFPTLPMGADGWNVYRRIPNGGGVYHLATIDMTVAVPPTEYVDDGTDTADVERLAPIRNTTSTENSILVEFPDPAGVPAGFTWKIYRTETAGDWAGSFLHWVVEETAEGSGIIVTAFTDTGEGTDDSGSPPTSTISFRYPEPISLDEIEGDLNPPRVVTPDVLEWVQEGPVTAGILPKLWICPWAEAIIRPLRANLGLGPSVPDAQPVQITVQKSTDGGVTFSSITVADMEIAVGDNATSGWSPSARPAPTDYGPGDLRLGDILMVEVVQNGAGANTDHDLVVQVPLWVRENSPTELPIVWTVP